MSSALADIAATARRKAVLGGLAALGYEVRETLATALAREGRIVVRKPGTQDYGVELAAPVDGATDAGARRGVGQTVWPPAPPPVTEIRR